MDNIERIASFSVDHRVLKPGLYISRVDGDVTTYDMRTRRPNMGNYMDNSTMHTFEHMFATFIRNSDIKEHVLYFGPMGCQTGFYLLVKNIQPGKVYCAILSVLKEILEYEGKVFGASERECGHYENLELGRAKEEAELYLNVLSDLKDMSFSY